MTVFPAQDGRMVTVGPCEKATRRELRLLHLSVQDNAAAAAVVVVAKRLDATTGAASAAQAGREVRLAIAQLRGPANAMDPELAALFAELERN